MCLHEEKDDGDVTAEVAERETTTTTTKQNYSSSFACLWLQFDNNKHTHTHIRHIMFSVLLTALHVSLMPFMQRNTVCHLHRHWKACKVLHVNENGVFLKHSHCFDHIFAILFKCIYVCAVHGAGCGKWFPQNFLALRDEKQTSSMRNNELDALRPKNPFLMNCNTGKWNWENLNQLKSLKMENICVGFGMVWCIK